MARGKDRHEIGAEAMGLLFPDGVSHIRGIQLGERLPDILARETAAAHQEGDRLELHFPVTDPDEKGRRVVVRVHQQTMAATSITAFLYSADRMDVDAAYRLVRKHLMKLYGKPEKELTGVLKFLWDLPDQVAPARTSVCRYRDNDAGVNILEVATHLKPGARLP